VQKQARAVNVGYPQATAFVQTQAATIDCAQASPVDGLAYAGQNLPSLLAAQDHGQLLWLGRAKQLERSPVSLEGILKEELDAAQGAGDRRTRQLALQGQVQEILAQIFLRNELGRPAEMLSQAAHGMDVNRLALRGETVQLHILHESST